MNAVSLSHWGIVEYPDDLMSSNTLFLPNGDIRRWQDDVPTDFMNALNLKWPYKSPPNGSFYEWVAKL